MLEITTIDNQYPLINLKSRTPKGFGISPYGFFQTIRFSLNAFTNGYFSYKNPDLVSSTLLQKNGRVTFPPIVSTKEIPNKQVKVAFLGDIMTSKSGNPPELGGLLRDTLASADIIVVNVESPIIDSNDKQVRNGLAFKMNNSYLKFLEDCNPSAKLVFNIANNHAADGSKSDRLGFCKRLFSKIGSIFPDQIKDPADRNIFEKILAIIKNIFPKPSKPTTDTSIIERTVTSLKKAFPDSEIIGAEVEDAKPVLSLSLGEGGPKIGLVGWTDVMNHDKDHSKKPIIRGSDITKESMEQARKNNDVLIAFPHGNEEQSYNPLKETRDRWRALMENGIFDCIIGHGPHTLIPAEVVSGNRPLFHSIGNFYSPKGKSQTKVGCVPMITFNTKGSQISSYDYDVHIIEQRKEKVVLIENLINEASIAYPKITIKRMQKIWNSLFT